MPDEKSESASADPARALLRRQLRTSRSALSRQEVRQLSRRITERAYPMLSEATTVAGYLALGTEVDVAPLLEQCRQNGQKTYAPVVKPGNTMSFVLFDQSTPLGANQYGIDEPLVPESEHVNPRQLDVVLVPLVGFDNRCNRLGMGGGYYDRSFAHKRIAGTKPFLLGVAYDIQYVDDVYADWWDVPLDCVVTPSKVFRALSAEL